MDTAIPEKRLREGLDQLIREVTEESAGILLVPGEAAPGDDICTVHIGFRKGFHSSLSLRADTALLTCLAQSMLGVEQVTPQDLEDVAKEYFNVLCGHIAAALYRATRVAARFSVPAFYRGSYSPEGHKEQFVLNYTSGQKGTAQLVHHVPKRDGRVGSDHIKS